MNNSVISKELFENWLAGYEELFIHLLPKKTSGLPQYLITDKIVILQVGLNMTIMIPDLKAFDNEWAGTLSFNKKPHYIQCPFESIVCIVGKGSHNNYRSTVLFERKITKEMLDAIAPQEVSEPVSSENVVSMKDFRNRKRK